MHSTYLTLLILHDLSTVTSLLMLHTNNCFCQGVHNFNQFFFGGGGVS